MGYLIAAILAIVLIILIAASMRGRGGRTDRGRLPADHDPVREQPAADEPTPPVSVTATSRQREESERHTPPA